MIALRFSDSILAVTYLCESFEVKPGAGGYRTTMKNVRRGKPDGRPISRMATRWDRRGVPINIPVLTNGKR